MDSRCVGKYRLGGGSMGIRQQRQDFGMVSQAAALKENVMKTILALFFILLFWGSVPSVFAADVSAPETVVNVAATSTAVSTRDVRRLLIIQNYSDATVFCKSGGRTAVVGEGWILNPQPAAGQAGGAIFFDITVPMGAVNCIHNGSGNKVISKTEG